MPEYQIENPILVYDACNDLLVDEADKVYKNYNWNEWGLSCDKYNMTGMEVFEKYKKDDIIPKHHRLCVPMKIVFY